MKPVAGFCHLKYAKGLPARNDKMAPTDNRNDFSFSLTILSQILFCHCLLGLILLDTLYHFHPLQSSLSLSLLLSLSCLSLVLLLFSIYSFFYYFYLFRIMQRRLRYSGTLQSVLSCSHCRNYFLTRFCFLSLERPPPRTSVGYLSTDAL